MAFKLTLPGFSSRADEKPLVNTKKADADKKSLLDFSLPLIGHLPIVQQLKILGGLTAVALLTTAISVYINNQELGYRASYTLHTSRVELFAERLAKDSGLALSGNSDAFDTLADARQALQADLDLLDKGSADLPATRGKPRAALTTLLATAQKTQADLDSLESGRPGLVTLGVTINVINSVGSEYRPLLDEIIASGIKRELVTEFTLAIERIARDAATLLATDISMEQMAQIGIDTYSAETALAAMPATDPNVQKAIELFDPYRNSIEILVGQSRSLVDAKAAVQSILQDTESLSKQTEQLTSAYQAAPMIKITGIIASVAGVTTLLLLLLIAKEYLEDSRRQTREAERTNQQNQGSILRLMNELGDLADGNLTVNATVSEDITGAIADSVNYTIEELRKLVARITAVATQMGQATQSAGNISKGLLNATQKQSREIQDVGQSVQLMTKSIQEVDASATKATEVGRRTLIVTEQGAQAVRNSITGMDGIREQIQDTAKRIKRLGESSQEIGEIVDLISDITDQTNVLALNAAIQAASAGEAGRGFSVVAEEVQRLAERSAEATKQIGSLVKTIQSDTHDAVAAMEKSTLGVVEGAKLSDVAGQSLQEIEQVSNELASLINSISVSTQIQTDMAKAVATTMQDILKIAGQTSEGTRVTAESVVQIDNLATDLKSSVAGFKI